MDTLAQRTVSKVRWRLLPFLFLCLFIAFLDRVNVGFAALQMNQDLGFTPEIYGFGAGLFFIGYFLFEVPSNLALHKFGARRWMARILITWGILAIAMAWVSGTTSLYVLRFLLGAAEAGFFPGVLLSMTYWFPREVRARTMATFTLGSVVSLVIGAPLSGAILTLGAQDGFKGWQWMFILEGVPAVLLGFVTLFALSDKPRDAKWLSAEERDWLGRTLQAEAASKPAEASMTALEALKDRRTLTLAFAIMLNIVAIYGISLWLPQIVKSVGGLSNLQVGFITAIPFACTAVAMLINDTHADHTGGATFPHPGSGPDRRLRLPARRPEFVAGRQPRWHLLRRDGGLVLEHGVLDGADAHLLGRVGRRQPGAHQLDRQSRRFHRPLSDRLDPAGVGGLPGRADHARGLAVDLRRRDVRVSFDGRANRGAERRARTPVTHHRPYGKPA